jgi:hypothetical protein
MHRHSRAILILSCVIAVVVTVPSSLGIGSVADRAGGVHRPAAVTVRLPDDSEVLPGPWLGAECLPLSYFETGYDKLSASRAAAIVEAVEIPAESGTGFRVAYDGFNAALDELMHREIALTLDHLSQSDRECGDAQQDADPSAVVQS